MPRYFDVEKAKRENPRLTDEEIQRFMRENNLVPRSRPAEPGMDTTSKEIFRKEEPEKPVKPQEEVTAERLKEHEEGRTFFQKVGDFFLPRATRLTEKLAGATVLKKDLDAADKRYKEFKEIADGYAAQAEKETDPERKKQLFDLGMQALEMGEQGYKEAQRHFEVSTGTGIGEETHLVEEAAGVAGEIGTYFMPAGKLKEGATLVQKIFHGAKMGGKVGLLLGITTPERMSLRERGIETVKQGGFGYVTGGLVSAAYEVPKHFVKKVFSGSVNRLAKVFKITPSKRAQFRKSTGGMNAEEEILARHGDEMSGMGYDDMVTFFKDKKSEAMNSLDGLLGDIKVKPKKMGALNNEAIGLIDDAISKADEGFLQEGAVSRLQKLKEEIARKPINSYSRLNELKKALQKEGRAAYSPTGKATNTSEALANAASRIQKFIEQAGTKNDQNLIREANRSIQLYSLVSEAVEKAGDREMVKVSNDLTQKLLQNMPLMLMGAAGYGGYKLGGVEGGASGLFLATLLMGGGGAARLKYMTPEVQTKIASNFSKILSSQGVKQADRVAKQVVNEMIKVATIRSSEKRLQERKGVVSGQTQYDAEGRQQEQQEQQEQVSRDIHGNIIPRDTEGMDAAAPDMDEMVTMRNKKTGEVRQFRRSEIGKPQRPGLPSKDDILTAMALDYAQTGGKNLSELQKLLDAQLKVEKAEGVQLSTTDKKRISQLNQAESVYDMVENLALSAPTGLKGVGQATIGKLPGIEGGAAEDLQRVTEGLAKAIAGALASEVGVATDKDVQRWLGLMPKVTDTMDERKRALKRLRDTLDSERKRIMMGREIEDEGINFEGGGSPF